MGFLTSVKERLSTALAADRVYREQLESIGRHGGVVLLSNLAVILIIGYSFMSSGIGRAAAIWTAVGGLLGVTGLAMWWMNRKRPVTQDKAAAAAQVLALFAGVRGLHWAVGFVMFMPVASPHLQTALGWALVGLLCGGAYAYSNIPKAAAAYIIPMSIGGMFAFMTAGHLILAVLSAALVGFCIVLILGAVSSTRLLQRHIEQQNALAEQKEFVGLLLKDFEDGATDWLFETDDSGLIGRGASRFAQNLKLDPDSLAGFSLVDLVADRAHAQEQRESAAALSSALARGDAFSDLLVTFGSGAAERFWKITAKPTASPAAAWRGVVADVTAAQQSQRRVAHLALHDSLTGLSNRVYFREKLNAALADLHSSPAERWAMCLDLDGFKSVNDTYGHHAGDKLLVIVARRLNALLGPGDVLSRMGGDEFALLTSPIGGDCQKLAESLLRAFEEPANINGHRVSVGASIGLVCLGRDGLTASDLMRHADLALYRAKSHGKGTWRAFEPEMDHALQRRLKMELELKEAIARDEFVIHYQPIASVATGEHVAYEALLRWRHPDRGLVMPSEFVPVAEEGGLIVQIGDWVIRHAIKSAACWDGKARVSINLAPQQVKNPKLGAAVVKALAESRIEPGRVQFEITETALLDETELVIATLKQLKVLGVRIALDDFGVGYSSLGYLHRFAFDTIKIDKSFVQAMETRKESAAVVRAVLGLAADLGMTTTAEGVETAEQLAAVTARGCTEAQGYFIGKPAAEPGADAALRKTA